ncbi:glycosyltransferase [Muricauda sp. JGD-17]|uniref:Glycosyltransferase n=1 Tax=Flagellimonas ochracea TaxID=2696472 RepID=A0A964WYP0_9FLAO|nr:glycosyltransferase [Allomuricauda ochracea]NAY93097.1 glycosyltransferase [Allomuricauda ochracea]
MSICLNMIVKNEVDVIERCLGSVKDHIDYWVIVDTGSTDGTQQKIASFLKDIPGELFERPWINFGQNRTEALQLAQDKGDYLLIIDADEILEFEQGFDWPSLTADAYDIKTRLGNLDYYRTQLVANGLNWYYEGVVHEYITTDQDHTKQKLIGATNKPFRDGARSSDPNKYRKDALLLENALLTDPTNTRNVFYLAQSYRDAAEYPQALKYYEKRIEMGGWEEEVWYSLYQIAVISEMQNEDWSYVLQAYLRAFEYRPKRAEPLYRIVLHYRINRQYVLGNLFATNAVNMPIPDDILFVETSIYRYALLMEYAICSYWVGNHEAAIDANNTILYRRNVPANVVQQVIANRKFSLNRIYHKNEAAIPKKNKIIVFVPFYNPGHFLDNCISSLLAQDYDDFEMIFIDDASTDNSHTKVPVSDSRVTLVRNKERMGGGYNIHTCLSQYCKDDDIYAQVDGDDWLACTDALSHINQQYNQYDCEVLYGQFRFANGEYGWSQPFSGKQAFSKLRSSWVCPAIRTFRAFLYHEISRQDPDYSCMKDKDGNWFKEAMDVALIYPIFELAGFDKVRYNDRVLYVYNNENPINIFRINRSQELTNHQEISKKKKFLQYELL